jgi:hypothetical protein
MRLVRVVLVSGTYDIKQEAQWRGQQPSCILHTVLLHQPIAPALTCEPKPEAETRKRERERSESRGDAPES